MQLSLVAVPNVSEGRDEARIGALKDEIVRHGAHVLDVHTDADHHRSVFTVAAAGPRVEMAMRGLASLAAELIDLGAHRGVHPRLGCLDVCPFVALDEIVAPSIAAARRTGAAIGADGLPVYLYGEAALRPQTRALSDLRRGGLEGLIERAKRGLVPDFGPRAVSRSSGVVCVGARGPLIAFNVWLRCDARDARAIAAVVREGGGGLPGVRALGLGLELPGVSQVSMNLTKPGAAGIDDAFAAVAAEARRRLIAVTSTEIVGLVPARFMPDPKGKAARLLMKPGRSLESMLR